MSMTAAPDGFRITGKTVLFTMIGFFAVIFAVNAYFVTVALQSYTGVVAQEPYKVGLAYNHRLEAEARQETLGWTDKLVTRADGLIELSLTDKDGKPLPGLSVKARLSRPATEKGERTATFAETVSGTYVLNFNDADRGGWILSAEAFQAGSNEPVYRLRRRVWLAP